MHRQGLRQGDPLSPFLFLLAADVLQGMITVANDLLLTPISTRIHECLLSLQYADDSVFLAQADHTSILTLKLTLKIFSQISGLGINFTKSSFVPLNLDPHQINVTEAILGCHPTTLLITYLGLPLTINKPNKHLFIPLIQKMEKRLEGWRGKLLSKGGRMQLITSVLSALPIYYMAAFKLPQWMIERLDRIRNQFLWGKSNPDKQGIHLINWELLTTPRQWGGLGIFDLRIQNIAFLLCWWWRLYSSPNALWPTFADALYSRRATPNGPRIWSSRGSFFWNQLQSIKRWFTWSTRWNVGDGNSISFWMDNWEITITLQP